MHWTWRFDPPTGKPGPVGRRFVRWVGYSGDGVDYGDRSGCSRLRCSPFGRTGLRPRVSDCPGTRDSIPIWMFRRYIPHIFRVVNGATSRHSANPACNRLDSGLILPMSARRGHRGGLRPSLGSVLRPCHEGSHAPPRHRPPISQRGSLCGRRTPRHITGRLHTVSGATRHPAFPRISNVWIHEMSGPRIAIKKATFGQ